MHVKVESSLFSDIINSLKMRQTFCSPEHHKACYDLIEKKFEKNKIDNALYIKTFCSAFVPYESLNLIQKGEMPSNELDNVFQNFDYNVFETIENTDDLMNYILEYYEDRLMPKKKFRKTCIVLNLTFKG